MHRALYIPELVLEILTWLNHSDKLHLGLTCSTIWHAAVSEIWEYANTLALYGLLPSDLRQQIDEDTEAVRFPNSVDETFWLPVLQYGAHTKQFLLSDGMYLSKRRVENECERLQAALHAFTCYRGTVPFLPRLESLFVCFNSEASIEQSIHLLSRPLKHLKIKIHLWKRVPVPSLTRLLDNVERSPLMDFLDIEMSVSNVPIVEIDEAIGRLVLGLPNLRSLSGRTSSWILSAAAQLRHLEHLALIGYNLESRYLADLTSSIQPQQSFPSLKSLSIEPIVPIAAQDFVALLHHISSPQFAEIELACRGQEPTLLQEAFGTIASKWSNTFNKLALHLDTNCDGDSFCRTLEPLLGCDQLKNFSLQSKGHFDFSDECYALLSTSWPRLQSFAIYDNAEYGMEDDAPRATRRSLESFAINCSSLEYLAISVDFDTGILRKPGQTTTPSSSSLLKLNGRNSTCTNSKAIAPYLQCLFPQLEALYYRKETLTHVRTLLDLPRTSDNVREEGLLHVRFRSPFSTHPFLTC